MTTARTLRGTAAAAPSGHPRSLLCFAQISDTHITDVSSPARVEYFAQVPEGVPLHRWPLFGAFRSNETLAPHTLAAMLIALADASSPATGARPLFHIHTGDACDGAQRNELRAFLSLLGGRGITPGGGHPYAGVQGSASRSLWYYYPDNPARDHFGAQGAPALPGLLDDVRRPLPDPPALPWYNLVGNHDLMLGGITKPASYADEFATGSLKPLAPPASYTDVVAWFHALQAADPAVPDLLRAQIAARQDVLEVAPDPDRAILDYAALRALHDAVQPVLPARALSDRGCYAFSPAEGVYVICLDTAVRSGSHEGALDADQAAWLEEELARHSGEYRDSEGRVRRGGGSGERILLFSHHTLDSMDSELARHDRTRPPLLGPAVTALLHRFPAVVALFNGHTHQHTVTPHPDPAGYHPGFWEVTTAALLDYPQQGRLVDLVGFDDGSLSLDITLVDHAGPMDPELDGPRDTLTLAGISRLLGRLDFRFPHPATAAGHGSVRLWLP